MLRNLDCVLSATLVASGLLTATACTVTVGETSLSTSDSGTSTEGPTETDSDPSTTGTTAGCPGTSAGCPGTSAGCPGTSAGCPGTSAGCPGTSAGCAGTEGQTVEESCQNFCDGLLACLPVEEHGFDTQQDCIDDCMINSEIVGTSECDDASISINECVAGLECQGITDWWGSVGDPPPCNTETIDVNIQCDGPAKCVGYCVVAFECLADEAMYESYDQCLSDCEETYEILPMSCQEAYSGVNICIATLTCEEALEYWNGDTPPYPCSDEYEVLENCD